MTLTFHGTREDLVHRIEAAAAAEGRALYIDGQSPDRIEIGFQRHGHRGGRYFYADVTENNGVLTLTGEAEDSDRYFLSPARRRWKDLTAWAGGFLFLSFCALVLWVMADDLGISPIPFWAALLIPTVWILIRIPMSRKEQQQVDDDFFDFLARALQ